MKEVVCTMQWIPDIPKCSEEKTSQTGKDRFLYRHTQEESQCYLKEGGSVPIGIFIPLRIIFSNSNQFLTLSKTFSEHRKQDTKLVTMPNRYPEETSSTQLSEMWNKLRDMFCQLTKDKPYRTKSVNITMKPAITTIWIDVMIRAIKMDRINMRPAYINPQDSLW